MTLLLDNLQTEAEQKTGCGLQYRARGAATHTLFDVSSFAVHCRNYPQSVLSEEVVMMDLEGIVAKRKDSPYHATEKASPHWIKIKNPNYSQAEGRHELFDR